MSKIFLYIASSIDGYIAEPDGNLDWLENLPNPNNIDHGYTDLLNSIDHIIMGRKTYESLLNMDIAWPYANYSTYIISSNPTFDIKTPNTYLMCNNIVQQIEQLKTNSKKNIWLVGGGDVVKYFLNNNLIDAMTISIVPIILGAGISLFSSSNPSNWTLNNSIAFETGIVNLNYSKKQ